MDTSSQTRTIKLVEAFDEAFPKGCGSPKSCEPRLLREPEPEKGSKQGVPE